MLGLATPSIRAQQEITPPDDADLANHAYTNDVGFGGYSVGTEDVSTIRLPISHRFRTVEEDDWGVRLKLPISFGVYNFDFPDIVEGISSDRLKTLAFVPGVEFQMPVSRRWTLEPYQDLGLGKDFEGGDLFLLSTTGLKGIYTQPWKAVTFTFGPGVRYSLSHSSSGLNNDDFAAVEVGLDTRYPLGIAIKDHKVDSSVYLIARHFFRTLVFQQPGGSIEIERQFEVGLTFGATPRPLVWKFRIPRITIGYRFGESLRGIRIKLGFPF
ncbi:MAG: hypothetical protein EP299_06955 [Acidobacteria bacterium]|nr:MAG: hypothetical protein EP299_06955 [Acidobacteriota bacterium]